MNARCPALRPNGDRCIHDVNHQSVHLFHPVAADPVHPPHYTALSIQPIEVIESWGLGFNLGTVLKYIGRAGRKAGEADVDDLAKAAWYLARELERRKAAR